MSASAGHSRRRRGMIFITVLAVLVILTGLVLVFASAMRTEVVASANRRAYLQADAVEQGAERWVLAQVEAYPGDAMTVTEVPAEALQVGQGYFWIMRPNQDSDQDWDFGIADESGKLNLNTASSDQIALLPGMTQDVADSIAAWVSSASNATSDGAESDYYESLPEPYACKNEGMETVEELFLVKGVTPQLMFGYDLNRNGVIDDAERNAGGGLATAINSASSDSRGIYNYVTVYTTQAGVVASAGPGRPRTASAQGLVNVNTASEAVLMCLGLSQSDADALIGARTGGGVDTTSTAWVRSVLGTTTAQSIAPYITVTSYQYSADIVTVSGDGRSFKRVRIVVDARQLPAKIVYRQDLTSLGWPLPAAMRQKLRSGQFNPTVDGQADSQLFHT